MPPIVVTFARPEESGAFRKRLSGVKKERLGRLQIVRGKLGDLGLICLHTGIGPAAAEEAIGALLSSVRPWMVLGAGFAGAVDPTLGAGDVVLEERPLPEGGRARIVSRAWPVETVAAKAALFRETGAQVVDMETETLAAACARAAVPMMAVRAVSDTSAEPLPVPFARWYDLERQRPRVFTLLAWLARHPSRIVPFARFVRRIGAVGKALALGNRGGNPGDGGSLKE